MGVSFTPPDPADPEAGSVTATPGPGETAMAVVAPSAAVTKEVIHEEASDLPEISWLWRRIYIFSVTYLLLALLWMITDRSTDPRILKAIANGVMILIGLGMMLYVAGASSEAITRLVGAVKTTRKEIVRTGVPDAPGGNP